MNKVSDEDIRRNAKQDAGDNGNKFVNLVVFSSKTLVMSKINIYFRSNAIDSLLNVRH